MIWSSDWHARLDREMVALPNHPVPVQSVIRRALGRDPVAFARIYLARHLTDKVSGKITFSDVHYQWSRQALTWRDPVTEPQQDRQAFIAPRELGKTTWWFLIIPLWAAAHGHARFIAAFAHAASQSETHLRTFKRELDTNVLLRQDYPDLCTPARRPTNNTTVADSAGMLVQRSGFVFAARGIDAATLGLKVGDTRPDVIIIDDAEPDEARYSPDLVTKRLGTIVDAVLPMNLYARLVMVGTVVMPGSIMHQLVRALSDPETAEPWIAEQGINVHHHLPIVIDDQGNESSIWPQKWSMDYLNKIRHTRMYAKNYANNPLAREGVYWSLPDFHIGEGDPLTRTTLVIDPAVTARRTSDFTGLVVGSWTLPAGRPTRTNPGTVTIRWARGVRLTGAPLRAFVAEQLLPLYPDIRYILVEVNQGGDLWVALLRGLGVRVGTHWSSESKEVRFARELDHWQRGRVLHSTHHPQLEEQAVGFPHMRYDDTIDAAVSLVHYHLTRPYTTRKATDRTEIYL